MHKHFIEGNGVGHISQSSNQGPTPFWVLVPAASEKHTTKLPCRAWWTTIRTCQTTWD